MNFKKNVDRSKNKERKWDAEFLAKEYSIDVSKKFYNLSIADVDFKSPNPVIKAIKDRAAKGTYSYTFTETNTLLAIKNWYKKLHDIDLELDSIKIVHGTVNAMFEFVKTFSKIGESVMIQTPVYQPFERAVLRTGRKVVINELKVINNSFEIDFKDFEQKISKNKVKIFMFCNPHNPGGRVWSEEEITKIIEICNKYDVFIFSDEVHGDLLLQKKHLSLLKFETAKKFVVCNSPNKGFNLGGLKGSFMICPNTEMLEEITSQYENDSLTSPNVFYQPALQAAYDNEESFIWFKNLKTTISQNYELILETFANFKQLEIMKMESSYLVWIKLNSELKWTDLEKDFLNSNLIFSYGSEFAGGEDNWIRINIGLSSNELKEVLQKMINVLNRRGVN